MMEQTERSSQPKDLKDFGAAMCSDTRVSNLKKLVEQFKDNSTNRVELDSWGNYHTDSFTRT